MHSYNAPLLFVASYCDVVQVMVHYFLLHNVSLPVEEMKHVFQSLEGGDVVIEVLGLHADVYEDEAYNKDLHHTAQLAHIALVGRHGKSARGM